MRIDRLIYLISSEIDKICLCRDRRLFHEFLEHGDMNLAIEFACDKIFEFDVPISEELGKMLQVIAKKLEITPERSWWPILIKETENHPLRRLYLEGPDLETPAREIFDKVRKFMEPEAADEIEEYFTVGELGLAVEGVIYCTINGKIPISRKDANRLKSIWLDMNCDPREAEGFTIQDEPGI